MGSIFEKLPGSVSVYCYPVPAPLSPSLQAAIERLKREGQVSWGDVEGAELLAFVELMKEGRVVQVFQPHGHAIYKLPN